MANLKQWYTKRIKRYKERIKRKTFFPKSWKGWLVTAALVFALLLLYTHPWDLMHDSNRPQLISERSTQKFGDSDAEMVLIDSYSEGNIEIELWKVESAGETYYHVSAWGHAIFGLVYPLDIRDNGYDGNGWISEEELDLSYTFSFAYGLYRYKSHITASTQLSPPKKQFSLT